MPPTKPEINFAGKIHTPEIVAEVRMQFGLDADDKLPRLRAAAGSADSLAALLKAFVARTFKLPTALTAPVHTDLAAKYQATAAATLPAPTTAKPGAARSKWTGYHRSKEKTPPARPQPPARPNPPSRDVPSPVNKANPSNPKSTPDQPDLLTPTPDDKG